MASALSIVDSVEVLPSQSIPQCQMGPIFSECQQKGFSPLLMGMEEAPSAQCNIALFCWKGYQLEQQEPDGLVVLQSTWMLL